VTVVFGLWKVHFPYAGHITGTTYWFGCDLVQSAS